MHPAASITIIVAPIWLTAWSNEAYDGSGKAIGEMATLAMKPHIHMARLLLLPSMPLICGAFSHTTTRGRQHQYNIGNCYEPYQKSQHNEERLHRLLFEMDPDMFSSPSQARKAIQHGRLMVLHAEDAHCPDATIKIADVSKETMLDLGTVASTTTILQEKDVIAIRSRIPRDECYPQSCTKYVDPPPNAADIIESTEHPIIFEDDHIAIVNKPEGMDTIGEKRNDLQSVLPFILRPPTTKSTKPKKNVGLQCYLPRPVHRLDRKTSGCVLVAKSENAMKQFSRMFANRQMQKSYCAITFGEPKDLVEGSESIEVNGNAFNVLDYPIDGKDAVTLWRVVTTITSPTWGKLSLLHLLPKTGRNHQLRRHLFYCLDTPIVGDSKYDGGGELAKSAREELGMYLCSNSMEFAHVMLEDETVFAAKIHLPDKFFDLLGLDRDDVLI